jgi:5-formyltetrahydrofolate cyclo-ligase
VNNKKEQLRKSLLQIRATLSPAERERKGKKIRDNFFSLECYKKAKVVMFYLSLSSEVPTDEMIEKALLEGKKVVVPCIKNGDILPSLLTSLSQTKVGNLGIREPKKKKFIPREELDLVVVPGCGFDVKGYRIGFGKGFYDRFLPELKGKVPLVALAFELQIIEEVPLDKWDIQMDYIVTEKRIFKIEKFDLSKE